MNKQIITLAIGSRIGNLDLAPIIPIKAPIEEEHQTCGAMHQPLLPLN